MRTLSIALLVLGLGVFVLGCKKRGEPTNTGDAKDPQGGTPVAGTAGKRGTFTVGKSTTYVTGPVDASGRIDYAAALNERLSKDVTAENNANVAIWKVLGPNPPGGGKMPTGFFDKMGMQTPPATGEYYIGLKQYAEQKGSNANSAFDARNRYSEQPWMNNQDPLISGWLVANHVQLTALREAVKKLQYYNPIIPETDAQGSKGIITSPMPGPQACRDIAGAFIARAMLFTGHGQFSEAWQDLMACHRLARLIARGGSLIEPLVGIAIDQLASRADVAYLDRATPDAKTIESHLKDLRSLPPMPNLADKVDICERFSFLENFMLLDRLGFAYVSRLVEDPRAISTALFDRVLKGIQYDPALENANKMYDQMAAALRENDRATRNQKLEEVAKILRKYRDDSFGGWPSLVLRVPDESAEIRAKAVGELYLGLMMPDARKVQDAADRAFQSHENVITAFARARYHRFNNRYPQKLADIAPTYLTQVPTDLFNGKALYYEPTANGYMLYSVGVNGRDEKGRGDDLVVRMPQSAKP